MSGRNEIALNTYIHSYIPWDNHNLMSLLSECSHSYWRDLEHYWINVCMHMRVSSS